MKEMLLMTLGSLVGIIVLGLYRRWLKKQRAKKRQQQVIKFTGAEK